MTRDIALSILILLPTFTALGASRKYEQEYAINGAFYVEAPKNYTNVVRSFVSTAQFTYKRDCESPRNIKAVGECLGYLNESKNRVTFVFSRGESLGAITVWDYVLDKATLSLNQSSFNEKVENFSVSIRLVGPSSIITAERRIIWKSVWVGQSGRYYEYYQEDLLNQSGVATIDLSEIKARISSIAEALEKLPAGGLAKQ